jgi:SAM-dependent methyltransferase
MLYIAEGELHFLKGVKRMHKVRSILVIILLSLMNGNIAHTQLTTTVSLSIVTSSPLPQGIVKYEYSQTLKATGGVPPYTWSVTSGALPSGMTLTNGGAIAGMPLTSAYGLYSFTVQVKDSVGAIDTAPFVLKIIAIGGYDKLYLDPHQTFFTTEPNAFLISSTKDLKPGSALDVGMGQGRNAVYLATKGWNVTGFDIEEEGLKAAALDASNAGVRLTTARALFEDYDYGKECWDLIYFLYVDAQIIDPRYIARIQAALKPGGLVLIEKAMLPLENSTPQKTGILPEPDKVNELVTAWSCMQIVLYEDKIGTSDWTLYPSVPRLESKARIVHLIARKL